MDDNLRIWRNFKLGKLVDLIMLDTRQYDRSITDTYDNTDYINKIKDDAGRSLMGSRQEAWLQRNLIESANRGAHWRILGSQIGMLLIIQKFGTISYSRHCSILSIEHDTPEWAGTATEPGCLGWLYGEQEQDLADPLR